MPYAVHPPLLCCRFAAALPLASPGDSSAHRADFAEWALSIGAASCDPCRQDPTPREVTGKRAGTRLLK